MSRAIKIIQAVFVTLTLAGFVRPLAANAQQIGSSAGDGVGNFDTSLPSAGALSQALRPPAPNPFQRPGSSAHKAADDSQPADSLLLQIDRKWTTALAQSAFTATPGFYSSRRIPSETTDWDSVVSGAMTAYVNRSYTTYVRMDSNFEMYGQKREAGEAGQPGGQVFTMQWQLAHLISSKLGPLEVAAGPYRQQLVAYPAFANSPLQDAFLGYSGSAAGLETSVTLPDKNLTFALRFGAEHLNGTAERAHERRFELSWTW